MRLAILWPIRPILEVLAQISVIALLWMAAAMLASQAYTTSSNFPLQSPFQGSNAGSQDAFVTKLNTAGNTLAYSTYLGGTGIDDGSGIAVDGSGNAYVTGYTTSSNFPLQIPSRVLIQEA